MKKKNLTYQAVAVFVLLLLASCKKYIAIDPPYTSISPATVFGSDNTAIAAQLNLYNDLGITPSNQHLVLGFASDEYTCYSTDISLRNIYLNSLNAASNGNGNGALWTSGFNFLYRINAILEGLSASSGLSPKVKQQTLGEALFMRAFWDFQLVNLYGDIPIVNSTDYKVNSALVRLPKDQVFGQIIKDLHQAQLLMSGDYLDATDLTTSSERIRPTKWAATALLARAYLYNKNWLNADSAASALINNPTFQLSQLTGASSVFSKNNPEAIWQLPPYVSVNNNATPDGVLFILTTPPQTGTTNCATVSPQLLAAFEPNDQRKVNWIGTYTQGTNTWYFPYKYKDGASATVNRENTMMLRLAEQYLIRAEARLYLNNVAGTLADLNAIRSRAGLSNYTGPTDNSSLLKAISHERQVELFGEGDRWFDLRRTGNLDALMGSPGNVTIAKGGVNWNSYQQYFPIPVSDISLSPSLTQTPGF